MACFCLKCFNEIEGTNLTYNDVNCDMDFCERCGENTNCVISICSSEERDED